jgi:hypothetical protein
MATCAWGTSGKRSRKGMIRETSARPAIRGAARSSWAPRRVELTQGAPGTLREVVLDVLSERDIPVLGRRWAVAEVDIFRWLAQGGRAVRFERKAEGEALGAFAAGVCAVHPPIHAGPLRDPPGSPYPPRDPAIAPRTGSSWAPASPLATPTPSEHANPVLAREAGLCH